MLKYVAVVAVALVLSVSGALGLAHRSESPMTSAGSRDPSVVMHAASTGDLDGTITALQTTLRRLPKDGGSWATLGLAYVEQARVTGDPTFYAKAEKAIATSQSVTPEDNFQALTAAAALASARHDFSGALRDADAALAIDSHQPQALALRVDALTELGRYREQLSALEVADRRQPGVPVSARYSYAYELRGRLDRARNLLLRSSADANQADRAFLLSLVADLDRRTDRLPAARRHLAQALQASPAYIPALVSRARLLIAQGRRDAALRQWKVVVGRLPLPEYLTELGELYLTLDRPAAAQRQFDVVDATVELLRANGVDADLETALFDADHGSVGEALSEARAEWSRRKSIHVADVLGWALHASGRDRAALRYARLATRLHTEEARLWLHRGIIEAGLGLDDAARRDLRHGLSIDPGVSPWQAARARASLRSLG